MQLDLRSIFNKVKILAICIGLSLVIFLVSSIMTNVSYKPQLAKYKAEIQSVTTQIEQAKSDAIQAEADTKSSATGLDVARVKTDDIIASKFLKKCLTWSSYDEYLSARNTIMTDYDLSDNDTFITVFFPNVIVTDASGNRYNKIDTEGLNMTFSEMKSHVVSIASNKYTYFTEVTVTSTANDVESSGDVIFQYSVDKDGTMSDIQAFTVAP